MILTLLLAALLLWKHLSDERREARWFARLAGMEKRLNNATRDIAALVGLVDVDKRQ